MADQACQKRPLHHGRSIEAAGTVFAPDRICSSNRHTMARSSRAAFLGRTWRASSSRSRKCPGSHPHSTMPHLAEEFRGFRQPVGPCARAAHRATLSATMPGQKRNCSRRSTAACALRDIFVIGVEPNGWRSRASTTSAVARTTAYGIAAALRPPPRPRTVRRPQKRGAVVVKPFVSTVWRRAREAAARPRRGRSPSIGRSASARAGSRPLC